MQQSIEPPVHSGTSLTLFHSLLPGNLFKSAAGLIRICWRRGLGFRIAFFSSHVASQPTTRRRPIVSKARPPAAIKPAAELGASSFLSQVIRGSCVASFHPLKLWTMLRVRCLRGGSRGAEAAHLIGAMVGIAVVFLLFFIYLSFLSFSFFFFAIKAHGAPPPPKVPCA